MAGDRVSASRVAPTTSGSAISDIIAAAAMNERPKTAPPSALKVRKPKIPWKKTSRPKIASTMLGVPAMISIADSTARASPEGRPYSVSQTAIVTPIGTAISDRHDQQERVPISGSRKPPLFALVEVGVGALGEQR